MLNKVRDSALVIPVFNLRMGSKLCCNEFETGYLKILNKVRDSNQAMLYLAWDSALAML